jgi:hypothetical protein
MIIAFGLVLMLSGCTERKGSPVGIDLIDEDQIGEGPVEIIVFAIDDTSFLEQVNAGASTELIVGSEGQSVMRSLLRFELLPEADSVLRATVKFRRSPNYSASTLEIIAYSVTADWDEIIATWEISDKDSLGEEVSWNQPGGDFDPMEVGRFSFDSTGEDSLFEMDLDTELVKDWIEGDVQNNGIILVSSLEGSDFTVASFVSRQSADGIGEPTIEVEYVTEDDPDTTKLAEFLVSNDVVLYGYEGSDRFEHPLLGDIPAFRTILRFDFPGFDSTWTIIRADLNVHLADTTHLHGDREVEAFAVLDSIWNGPDTEVDNSILANTTVSPGDSILELNMTGMVQLWVSGDFDNNGIILRMGRSTDLFGFLGLHGSSASDPDRRPFLEIFYHVPGDPPFGSGEIVEKTESKVME